MSQDGLDGSARLNEQRAAAVRHLVSHGAEVGRVSGRGPWWRELLKWVSRGRWGVRNGWPVVPIVGTPWQDTISAERIGWRTRAAMVHGDDSFAFAVDYQICAVCRLGWVEQPYTLPQYQRHGLATAGLASLRAERPGLSWHTLGGHFHSSEPFWMVVGVGVPGGYQQRAVCQHIKPGG